METRIEDKGGVLYRAWRADSPKAALLLVHGLGAHSERWGFLAEFFLSQGVSSYAVELTGFGHARPSKNKPASFGAYHRDILKLYEIIKEDMPGRKIFLVGESMGGVIALLFAADRPGLFDGLICISPALKSSLNLTFFDYIRIFLPVFYNPERLNVLPFSNIMCTRDADYRKVMEAETSDAPQATSRMLADFAMAQVRCRVIKGNLKTPALFLVAGKDMIADSGASKAFFNGLKLKDKKLIEYPGMYHSLSIDLGREKAFEDMWEWMRCHCERTK